MLSLASMDTDFRKKIEKKYVKRETDIRPGDTVKVHIRIIEGGKERVQIFEGIVISLRGSGLSRTVTVRKMSHGVGVEKILPINSPMISKIDISKRGNVRRAKLNYMRERVGKSALDIQMDEAFEEILEAEEGETAEKEVKEEKADSTKDSGDAKDSKEKSDKKSDDGESKDSEGKKEKKKPKKEEKTEKPDKKEEKADKKKSETKKEDSKK